MILVNGLPLPAGTHPVDPTDRGLTLGDGLFETFPVFAGRGWLAERHLDRLMAGLAAIGLVVPRARIAADLATAIAAGGPSPMVARITVTRGAGARGLAPPADPSPTVIVALSPFNPALIGEEATLVLAQARRNAASPVSALKALAYLDAVLALADARRQGCSDALFLDTRERIASTTVANVFLMRGGRLLTPAADGAILPGILRGRLLEGGPGLGLAVEEAALTLDDLAGAEAMILTNSVRLAQPVTRCAGFAFPGSAALAGRIVDWLAGEIRSAHGVDPRRPA